MLEKARICVRPCCVGTCGRHAELERTNTRTETEMQPRRAGRSPRMLQRAEIEYRARVPPGRLGRAGRVRAQADAAVGHPVDAVDRTRPLAAPMRRTLCAPDSVQAWGRHASAAHGRQAVRRRLGKPRQGFIRGNRGLAGGRRSKCWRGTQQPPHDALDAVRPSVHQLLRTGKRSLAALMDKRRRKCTSALEIKLCTHTSRALDYLRRPTLGCQSA